MRAYPAGYMADFSALLGMGLEINERLTAVLREEHTLRRASGERRGGGCRA
jgi:hypothetical protein